MAGSERKSYSESVYPEHARRLIWSRDLTKPLEDLAETARFAADPREVKTLDDFAWDPEAANNLLMAVEYNMVEATAKADDQLEVRLRPLPDLPAELGHVTSLERFRESIDTPVWGNPAAEAMTYLQATDFSVEAYQHNIHALGLLGRTEQLVFLYVDTERLRQVRNVYVDPESLDTTPEEFGASYVVLGGVPRAAIRRAELIELRGDLVGKPASLDYSQLQTEEQLNQSFDEQMERLRQFFKLAKDSSV